MSRSRPNSGRLERLASGAQQYDTRTRNTLSFDLDGSEREPSPALNKGPFASADSSGASSSMVSSTTKAERNPLARLSRKLFSGKANEDQSSSEGSSANTISSQTDTAPEDSPSSSSGQTNRWSYRLQFPSRPASTESSGEGSSSSPSRRSMKLFSPKVSSKLRSNAEKANDEDSPPRQESPRRGDEEETKTSSSDISRSPSRRLLSTKLMVSSRKGDSGDGERNSPVAAERVTSGESSPSPSQRISRRFFSARRTTNGKRPEELFGRVDTDDLAMFQYVVDDWFLRDQFVGKLLALHIEGGSSKVRFVAAVNEYERTTNRSDKSALGKKILSTFIQRNANFPLAGIVIEEEDKGLESLPLIRATVTVELLENSKVVEALKDVATVQQDLRPNSDTVA